MSVFIHWIFSSLLMILAMNLTYGWDIIYSFALMLLFCMIYLLFLANHTTLSLHIIISAILALWIYYDPHLVFLWPVYSSQLYRVKHGTYFLAYGTAILLLACPSLLLALFLIVCSLLFYYFYHHECQQCIKLKELLIEVDANRSESLRIATINQTLSKTSELAKNEAILNERRRISRDIHDNVGHELTSSILQVKLLRLRHEELDSDLALLEATLTSSLDQIRHLIHDLHRDSADFALMVRRIIDEYRFCPVHFTTQLQSEPPTLLSLELIGIIKEALSNVAKHSDATRVDISFTETPSTYTLLIIDNGNLRPMNDEGLGLISIKEKIYELAGDIHITNHKGFRLYMTLPKNQS
ncbi:sensor histidine kinase [Hutsoniella sourekii]